MGFRVQGSGFRVQGAGFAVPRPALVAQCVVYDLAEDANQFV
jgi:hypothetical protein